jgi:cysteinyl-tRNA synthetase
MHTIAAKLDADLMGVLLWRDRYITKLGFAHFLQKKITEHTQMQRAVPDEVHQWARERLSAKQQKDFTRADELRKKIIQAGYHLIDTPDGYDLEPAPTQG